MERINLLRTSIFTLLILFLPSIGFSWTANYQWPNKEVTIDISGANGTIAGESYKNLAVTGMSNWLAYCGPSVDFAFHNTDLPSDCSFNVRDSRNCTGWADLGTCSGTFTVGQTMMWLSGDNLLEADVALNSQCNSSGYWTTTRAIAVLSHEYGHAIGLGHSSDASALMYPYLKDSIWFPQADDCAGFRYIYGSSLSFETNTDVVTVPEGGTATFQVRLSAQPTANVVASLSRFSGDADISVISGSSLSFTTSNWNLYQTVTLRAAEDPDRANGSTVIRVSAPGVTSKDVTADELDNETISTVLNDLNGDGKTDLLWQHQTTGGIYAWLMDGTAFISGSWVLHSSDLNWKLVGTGDFNGDGKTDLVWQHQTTGGIYIWLMDGTTLSSGAWVLYSSDLNWVLIGTGDFNMDGKTDLLWQHKTTGGIYVWLMDGLAYSSGSWVLYSSDLNWKLVGTGDFNGDGKTDLVWQHQTTGGIYIWLMDGTTLSSGAWVLYSSDLNWVLIGTGDFNMDGKTDLLWQHQTTGGVYVWLMDGTTFSSGTWVLYSSDLAWKLVAP